MSPLFMLCLTTQQSIPTGVQWDADSLATIWLTTIYVACPSCGQTHECRVRDAYLHTISSVEKLGPSI